MENRFKRSIKEIPLIVQISINGKHRNDTNLTGKATMDILALHSVVVVIATQPPGVAHPHYTNCFEHATAFWLQF